MPLGLILGIGRAFRRKRPSSLDILSSKRAPRGYYKGKNCKPTGFHTRKGGYVVMQEKLPNYVVPDLTDFKVCIFHSFNLATILSFLHLFFFHMFTVLTFALIHSYSTLCFVNDEFDIVPLMLLSLLSFISIV
ncbi:39S ribosomal protein L41-A [Spatholobus suberectus]|nr:39S ribosomal protein L41-A [Spatholobus suberectus]